jgi:molybdenum cofactor cytidylyltransferase
MTREVEGILLAAGESRRMRYPKPLLRMGERTFVEHLAALMLESVARLVIVLGAHADRVRKAVPADSRISVVENPNYLSGQSSSLKAGLKALGPDATAALVHLADHPTVRRETFAAMVAAHRRAGAPIIIARWLGQRGHPVLFDRSVFGELQGIAENRGANTIVDAAPERVLYVDVEDAGVVLDLDTPDDLRRAGLPAPPGCAS